MAKNITPQEKNFMTIESLKHRWELDSVVDNIQNKKTDKGSFNSFI